MIVSYLYFNTNNIASKYVVYKHLIYLYARNTAINAMRENKRNMIPNTIVVI